MNIRIVQILEGGIDLETMQELSRSMLLVYGEKRVTLPVSDEQLKIVMQLIGAAPELAASSHSSLEPAMARKNGAMGPKVAHLPSVSDEYSDSETGVSSF